MADTSNTNFKQEIGRRIAIRRRELGLTQKALAEAVGLSRDFVAQVEIGRLEINAGDIPLMCVMLGVPVSYFFNNLVTFHSDHPLLEGIRKLSAVGQGELTAQEALLLHNYRALNYNSREAVDNMILQMARAQESLNEKMRELLGEQVPSAVIETIE